MKVKAHNKQKVEFLVGCLAAEKESIDALCNSMEIHMADGHKGKANKDAKLLSEHIKKYNAYAKEYKKLTGDKLELASTTIPADIKKGNDYQTLPTLVYADGSAPVAQPISPKVVAATSHTNLATKKDLTKVLDKNEKQLKDLKAEFNELAKNKNESAGQQKVLGIVNCLCAQKMIVDKNAENLLACCQVSDIKRTAQWKKNLANEISVYNNYVAEYENITGGKLTRASVQMPEDIIGGRVYTPIPTISYTVGDSTAEADKKEEKAKKFNKAKKQHDADAAATVAVAKTALEKKIDEQANKDLSLLTKCADYKVSMLESERDMANYRFSANTVKDIKNAKKHKKQIAKKIAGVKKDHKNALVYEQSDNERYYAVVKNNPKEMNLKNKKKVAKVESIRSKMITLLNKRDELNGKLIAIYTGTEVNLDGSSVNQKWRAIKNEAAEKAVKKDKKLAKKIAKLGASDGEKQNLYNKLNDKLDATSTLALCEYRLKKERNSKNEKKALKKDIKVNKAAIKQYNEDLQWMLKKTRDRTAKKHWGAALVIVLLLVAAAAAGVTKYLGLW